MPEEKHEQQSRARHHDVKIIIDRQHLESPTPTTGAALYMLGKVAPDYTLYRETPGPKEDEPIPNSPKEIHLQEDEKFYSSPNKVTPGGKNA